MKIAFVTALFPPHPGGMERWNWQIARAYCKAGNTVTIYHFCKSAQNSANTPWEYIPLQVGKAISPEASERNIYSIPETLFVIFQICALLPRLLSYSVWHVSFGEAIVIKTVITFFSGIFNKKIIVTIGSKTFDHVFPNPWHKVLIHQSIRWICKQASMVLVDGKDIIDELVKNKAIDTRNKIHVTYAGVDTSIFNYKKSPDEVLSFVNRCSKNASFLSHKPFILFCGRFSYENGLPFLFEVLKSFKEEQVLMIGDGPDREFVREEAMHLPNMYCVGTVPYELLPYFYSLAAICVYPLSSHIGGISQVIPLTMACKGLVCTRGVGDNRALISSGQNGFILESVEEMNQIVHEALLYPEKFMQIRTQAEQTIQSGWQLNDRDKEYGRLLSMLTVN